MKFRLWFYTICYTSLVQWSCYQKNGITAVVGICCLLLQAKDKVKPPIVSAVAIKQQQCINEVHNEGHVGSASLDSHAIQSICPNLKQKPKAPPRTTTTNGFKARNPASC